MTENEETPPLTSKLRAARRRPPRASRACETCRVRKTKCPWDSATKPILALIVPIMHLTVSIELADITTARLQLRGGIPKSGRLKGVSPNTQQGPQHNFSPNHSPADTSRAPRENTGLSANSTINFRAQNDEETRIASRDGLSGVNIHTNGTEFYGNSSNLAFLGNLYARARSQAENRVPTVPDNGLALVPHESSGLVPHSSPSERNAVQSPQSASDGSKPTNKQLSIVNLLYNPTYAGHSPPHLGGQSENGKQRTGPHSDDPGHLSRGFPNNNDAMVSLVRGLSDEVELEIEKIFIGSYFSNKHYIHPMLCKSSFMQRCEQEAFVPSKRKNFYRGSSKFSGVYFAVVATGAINASPNETALLDHYCSLSSDLEKKGFTTKPSALDFADFYFAVAKQALGDLFESSSLETVWLFGRPLQLDWHRECRPCPSTFEKRPYEHGVKCADSVNQQDPDAEENDIGMIPAIVALAQIMTEASHLLYNSPKRSTIEKSQIAMNLDKKVFAWKSNLPSFLNIDAAALNDSEWAFKQKLVLRLRFYNTLILIHRPFLAASTSNVESPNTLQHVYKCLDAARTSIRMQYESFLHRIYIRTWWYMTTYALYGAMILLHLVLSGVPGINDDELLTDVDKSLEIFESMNNIVVARRCAEMIREVLEVARTCVARRRSLSTPSVPAYVHNPNAPFGLTPDASAMSSNRGDIPVVPAAVDNDFFLSLFNQDSQPDTRAELLANLVNPSILEDFAFGNGGNDFSYFLGS
ncbi:hypothetical protein FE257_000448 [Aspergillus nanangensis]|uniref:Transcription factor domain-containing protein n=1 Tax=Aspergillus nanangensis TaxID=2582783 RepID=A0AAD4GWJ8_ASPNN|nr:hypothetical protein FE257_000448 [Aspergillus nanangensis]